MNFTLPSGHSIEQINPVETSFLVHEIFERQVYPVPDMNGVDSPFILDVGANIGVFACYALHACPEARVVCCEPAPPVAEVLEHNVKGLGGRARVLRCAVGAAHGNMQITYYPGYSIMSRLNADSVQDHQMLNSCVRQDVQAKMKHPRVLGEHHVATMVDEMLGRPQSFDCLVRTLPEIIQEQGAEQVDYLKMDVEGSELEILQSLPDDCWLKIHNIGLEVHERTQDSDVLGTIKALLLGKGYTTHVGDVVGLGHPHTAMLYGSRPR